MSIKPMERWWVEPISKEPEAVDTCIHGECDQLRQEGRPSCARHWCRTCFGYGFLCDRCGEGPAMCVCAGVNPIVCHACEGGRETEKPATQE